MKIKKLEIAGFKSFADRAVLQFGAGITGVVGPNGCGKSNVVDALRWCMGEMSAKNLRGRAMQDVIFAGSDHRGPMGLAEVTITFENDGTMPANYAAYAEVAVTRRLFRDGSSAYLINNVPVRLRDVTDLFLDTGVGSRAYSIIEQGRIGFIVNAKPEERRALIEEVAGISKYKVRRKTAERRLHQTEQNLLRVTDIISELERQLGSLRRQAKKAERYKALREQLRDLELHLAVIDWLRMGTEEQVQRRLHDEVSVAADDQNRSLAADEAKLEARRVALLEDDAKLQETQQASAAMDAKLAGLERDLEHWQWQLDEAQKRGATAADEVAAARQALEKTEAEKSDLEAQVVTLQEEAGVARQSLQLAERDAGDLVTGLEALDEQIEAIREEALTHVQTAAQQRTLASGLERQRLELEVRLAHAQKECEQLAARANELEQTEGSVAAQLEAVGAQLQTDRGQLEQALEASEEVAEACAAQQREVLQLKETLGRRRSRLSSLEEIAKRFEGYSDGVRTLMKRGEPAVAGIVGVVSDVLEVPSDYETALEAVLRDKLQFLLVEQPDVAQEAIALLRKKKGGQSGFVPLDPRSRLGTAVTAEAAGDTAPAPEPQGEGIVGAALALVRTADDDRYSSVLRYLLEDVWVVRELADARAAWSAAPGPRVYVTLSGEVLDAGGVVRGGSAEGAGLLAKRREIRELTAEVEQLTATLQQAEDKSEQLAARQEELGLQVQSLEQGVREAELQEAKLGKDVEAVRRELTDVSGRRVKLEGAFEEQKQAVERMQAEEQEAVTAADAAEERHQSLEGDVDALQERRGIEQARLGAHQGQVTDLKVQLNSREEKLVAARTALSHLSQREVELKARIGGNQESINQSTESVAELTERLGTGRDNATTMAEEAQAKREALAASRTQYETDREALIGLEDALKTGRKKHDSQQQALLEAKMALQRLSMEHDNLVAHVFDRHDVELSLVVCDYHLLPLPGEEAPRRCEELERQIKGMGAINLTAIEECAEVESRFAFLVGQRDDLTEAMGSLQTAITRMDRASRERFKEAFVAVNDMFKQVYPRLFRGGEARLELTESDDLLTAGVDIIAMPPGKKLQNVGLLSGGEKALTATALVFAIFLIKPSPFCVLDEVDAPLDEANVGRFNEMLREISAISQFIVITHNKQTMAESDRLYGVTMEEPGLSKLVSVDLRTEDGSPRDEVAAAALGAAAA